MKIRVQEDQRRDIEKIGKLTASSLTGGAVRIDNIARLNRGFESRISAHEPAVLDQLQLRRRADAPRASTKRRTTCGD